MTQNDTLTEMLKSKKLTNSEIKIVTWTIQGYRGKEVSSIVGLTSGTIKAYMRMIYLKLGVTNQVELVLCCAPFMDLNEIKNKFHD